MMTLVCIMTFLTIFMGKQLNFKGFMNLFIIFSLICLYDSMGSFSQFFYWDFLSKAMVVLTAVIMLFTTMCSKNWNSSFKLQIWMSILYLTLQLSFSVSSMLMFYMFFEFSLLPIIVIIYGWGYYPERHPASIYMFFYTFSASLPLLIIISSSNFLVMDHATIYFSNLELAFMYTAFLVKLPMFLFHLWLPMAHVEAPVYGSMVLAGVMLKLGGYGLIRVLQFSVTGMITKLIMGVAMVGASLTCLTCFFQSDMKSLVALSSVSHMSLMVMVLFSMNIWSLYACVSMMIAHGLISSGMFFLVNIMYSRSHSRSFYINKGCEAWASSILFLSFTLCACNMAAPPSMNFISEMMMASSIMNVSYTNFFLLGIYIFSSALYTMYFFFSSFILKSTLYYIPVSIMEIHVLAIHCIPTILAMLFISLFW